MTETLKDVLFALGLLVGIVSLGAIFATIVGFLSAVAVATAAFIQDATKGRRR